MNVWRDTVSRELHATFVDSPSNGSHVLPLVAQPVARWWPGTVDTPDANKLSKPGDGSRGHTQARDETINFNVAFPAPVSRKVATKPTRFVL